MDESIGAVMEALHSKHMLDNSIVIFISDNGGQPYEGVDPGSPLPIPNAGLNLPLRGGKSLLYEGGIRVPALVWSPLLNKSGYVSEALVHVTDLLPTVLDGIDGTGIVDQDHIYGVSQWSTIANDNPPVRWEIQHNVDPVSNSSAIRWFDWKLIQTHKQFGPSKADYGYQFIDIDNPGIPFPTQQSAHRLNSKMYGVLTHMNRRPDYTVLSTSTIECRPVPDSHFRSECMSAYCLFNVRHDPCEQYDLIGQTDRRFVQFLRNKIVRFNATSVPPLSLVPNDPKADPKLYNYTYVNWLDYYENENSQFVTD
ncbi:unnamed protein product [Medioppia subpectinata]|uniref:Sulfatase N-terminal domain-containing protein n=1 Tax=Medioppia subpectinata TaxID=1979941 RepID=A0A7R9PU29_9ACAR|nr:unnamed protein product [Medioppia subpectinata]CAG2101318.1 unnamed protein product [Medioppia subpectinata]